MINNYKFIECKDSPGNNILRADALANDIPKLKMKCDSVPSCVGFNTDGWLKSKIIPELLWLDTVPSKGFYYTGVPASYIHEKIIKPPEEPAQILTPLPKLFNNDEKSANKENQIMENNPFISFPWKKICYIMTTCICLLMFLEIIVKLMLWIVTKI